MTDNTAVNLFLADPQLAKLSSSNIHMPDANAYDQKHHLLILHVIDCWLGVLTVP